MKALRMTGKHEAPVSDSRETIIEGGGFVLTQQTIDALATIDLRKVMPKSTRNLVLMRDDLAANSQKLDQWAEQDLDLEYRSFSGYADIVAEPHYTKVPFDAIEQIVDWVASGIQVNTAAQKNTLTNTGDLDQAVVRRRQTIVSPSEYEIENIDGKMIDIEESIFHFGEDNRLFGILSKPLTDAWKTQPTVILANAGAVHHVGPNRLYVLLTRNLSRLGLRCLRMDLPGLGDSFIENFAGENDSYVASASEDIDDAINALREDAHSFVVMGLCSGAHAAFHVALDLKARPIVECFLINPLTFYWKEGMSLSAPPNVDNRWHYYKHTMRNKQRWIKFLRGQANTKAILNTIKEKAIKSALSAMYNVLESLNLASRPGDNLNRDVKDACSGGKKLSFVFSSQDPGFDILMSNAKNAVKKCIKRKSINIAFIEGADHTFTTRAHRIELTNKLIGHFLSKYQGTSK
jgi:pimeloyl-ACP methyl ester carboxylesterase